MSLNVELLNKLHEMDEKYPDSRYWSKEDVAELQKLAWGHEPKPTKRQEEAQSSNEKMKHKLLTHWQKGWSRLRTQSWEKIGYESIVKTFKSLDAEYYELDPTEKYKPTLFECKNILKRMIKNAVENKPRTSGYEKLKLRREFFIAVVDIAEEHFGSGRFLSIQSEDKLLDIAVQLKDLFR